MSEARTEQPTPRRLAAARRRGQVACSRELTGAAALLGGALAAAAAGPGLLADLAGVVRGGLAAALGPAPAPGAALAAAALEVARRSAAPLLAAAGAALAAGALQTGFLLAPAAASPRLDRLAPGQGLARLLSRERLAAVGLGAGKALLVGLLVHAWASGAAPSLARLPRALAPGAALPGLLEPLALRLGALLLALGAVDLLLARRRFLRGLRMTRPEVRREQREEDGDPALRAERRRRHRALAGASPVAQATCVVVNPTRVAVALVHRRGQGEAPRVVAKGTGAAARRIRSVARRHGVPVVRDPPLARALHRLAEVGDEIPEPLFEAAAAVLAHLHRGPSPEAG